MTSQTANDFISRFVDQCVPLSFSACLSLLRTIDKLFAFSEESIMVDLSRWGHHKSEVASSFDSSTTVPR
jgi:hypothetical protein